MKNTSQPGDFSIMISKCINDVYGNSAGLGVDEIGRDGGVISPTLVGRALLVGDGSPALYHRALLVGDGSPALCHRALLIGDGSPALCHRALLAGWPCRQVSPAWPG